MSAFYSVGPEEQAVVSRFGVVDRVEQPGLQVRLPIIERVDLYSTRERELALEGPYDVSGCPADVELIYLIDDVVAFHEAGADFGAIDVLVPQVANILSQVPQDSATPGPDARRLLSDVLSEERPGGLRVLTTRVDLGECGPQPPRIEMRREGLPGIETVGALGSERVPLPAFETDLRNGRGGIEIKGAVATYDIIEEGQLLGNCYSSADFAHRQIASSVISRLRRQMIYQPTETLASISERFPETIDETLPEFRTDCGIAIRAIDYDAAEIIRLTPINCNETPDAPECASGEAGQP